jgi:hypothetical protein
MAKVILGITLALVGLLLIGAIANSPQVANGNHDDSMQKSDTSSVGYLPPGQCMSADKYNWAAGIVVKNTDWSRIEGSASFSPSTKSLVGGVTVFKEMARLGTPACPDLAPIYDRYLASTRPAQPPPQAPSAGPDIRKQPVRHTSPRS